MKYKVGDYLSIYPSENYKQGYILGKIEKLVGTHNTWYHIVALNRPMWNWKRPYSFIDSRDYIRLATEWEILLYG